VYRLSIDEGQLRKTKNNSQKRNRSQIYQTNTASGNIQVPYEIVKKEKPQSKRIREIGRGNNIIKKKKNKTQLRFVLSGGNFGTFELDGGGGRGRSREVVAVVSPFVQQLLLLCDDGLERLGRQYVIAEIRTGVLPTLVITVVFRAARVRFVFGARGRRGGRRRVTGSGAGRRRFVDVVIAAFVVIVVVVVVL